MRAEILPSISKVSKTVNLAQKSAPPSQAYKSFKRSFVHVKVAALAIHRLLFDCIHTRAHSNHRSHSLGCDGVLHGY